MRESWVSNVYTFTSENGGTGTLRNFNFAGGNVGIGTTNAAQLLTVGGNVQVNGAFYDGAQAAGTSGQVLTSTGTATAWKTANPTSNGTIVLGDSIGAGTGATPSTNGFAYLLRQQVGGPYFNYSKSGDQAADMSIHWLMPDTNPQGGGVDPVMIQEIGTNDVTRYTTTTNLQNVFNRIIMNNLSWGGYSAGQQEIRTGMYIKRLCK